MAGLVAQGFGIAIMPNIPFLKYFDVDIIKLKPCIYKEYLHGEIEKQILTSCCGEI
ncbi:MAG: hypothetical protein ACLRPW_02710 [Intestinibacter sp.]